MCPHSQFIPTGTKSLFNLNPEISYVTNKAISVFSPEERDCYEEGEMNLTYLSRENGYRYGINHCLINQLIKGAFK